MFPCLRLRSGVLGTLGRSGGGRRQASRDILRYPSPLRLEVLRARPSQRRSWMQRCFAKDAFSEPVARHDNGRTGWRKVESCQVAACLGKHAAESSQMLRING